VAVAVAVVALTRDGGDDRTVLKPTVPKTAAATVTDDIVSSARSGTIYIESAALNRTLAGTGVLLDAHRGLVLTNFHVVALGSDIQAGTPHTLHDAEVEAAAPCEDLALLRVHGLGRRRPIRLGRRRAVEQGDPVVALGYPVSASGGKSLTTTVGVVSSTNTRLRIQSADQPRYSNLVQADAALAPGDSGGPLVGADGRLVGVNTIIVAGGAATGGQGYAIGVDRVREVLRDLRRGRSRAWFGAGLVTPSLRFLRRERLPSGMLLTGAQGGTSASELGLEDVLVTGVNGRRVGRSLSSYCRALGRSRSGDTVTLRVIRSAGGEAQTIRAKLD
jgi:S1-C subfamily serine protease